jgi:hypothetical protein
LALSSEYEKLCKTSPEVNGNGWHEISYEECTAEYDFPAPVSKLSELTLDEMFILRSSKIQADRQGQDWLGELWQRVVAGDAAYAPVRDLVMRSLDWVRSLNDADFELPVAVHYGRIRTGRENANLLWSFGVELGHYDHVAESFHVRVNARASRALEPYRSNFPLDGLKSWDDTRSLSDIDKHDPELLDGAKAYLTFLLHSHHGDGSAATNRSGMGEHWQELLDDIDAAIIERSATLLPRLQQEGRLLPTP